ncbi:Aquaporin-3 [Coemansia spiralis]|uniref:Aquaporin-3 n=2 Tax=Coemansia TaxID=4863 RepID=A0A9W8G4L2_9FUNG|nr:aquaporin-like protein [Coemansia spiralis]KAJ1989198.1 Aquaporin-3 [Coemansia umbellata]KAJ2620152.1 Aquaporin-3 [Coemansia sp. RSA 1358]KAJ2672669.1 Aquaporin-3 [Coemansia spiralis]
MASLRNVAAPYWAEFIGTLVLTLIGLGATTQNLVSVSSQKTEAISSSLAWGLAVTFGIWVSDHVSGGHINPAVTISRAIFSGFSAARVVGYVAAQTLGAFTGAFLVWLNFSSSLAHLKHKDPGLHPATGAFITSNNVWFGFVNEITASFLFVLAVFAITDNTSNAKSIAPLAIGLSFSAVSFGLSSPLGLAINPARDFGPRFFAALAYGFDVFVDNKFYFWVPLAAPVGGGLLGAFVYEWLVKRDAEYHQHTLEDGDN